MPTGKDRAVLPGTQEKTYLHSLLGQVSEVPCGWENRQETVTQDRDLPVTQPVPSQLPSQVASKH